MPLRTSLVAQPHLYMGDTQGRPLDAGKVYFGEPNKDPELYPINVYYDEALTIAAPQPIRTMGGFMNANGQMVEVYAAETTYSVKVLDAYGRQVFYQASMSSTNTSASISTRLPYIDAKERTQADKNTDIVSIKDFNTPDDAYSYAQTNLAKVFVPNGNYDIDAPNPVTALFYGVGTINNKPLLGESLYAFSSQFGIKSGLSTSVGAEIQNAINICHALGMGFVLEGGTYLTSQEIKVPSMTFRGIGLNKTKLKAHVDLPAISNVITNSTNDYSYRTTYDEDVHISDMEIDADWRGRYAIGDDVNNQACGIKFSAVRTGSIKRVIVRNAALHCIDISADQYVYDGGNSANATNQSSNIILEQCYAFNSYRDDGITTHNSNNITIKNCYAEHDGSLSVLDNVQNGIEIDEGSSNVTVVNCYSKGWAAGFQTKGHATTKPAEQVVFDNSVSDACRIGFMVSVGTNPSDSENWRPSGIRIVNCRDRNSLVTPTSLYPRAISLYGCDGVSVENFTCEGVGRIVMTQNVRNVDFKDIYFLDVISSEAGGCLEMYSSSSARVTIKNVVSRVTQLVPLVAKTGASNHFTIDGVWGRGSAGVSAVKIEYGNKDSVLNVNQTGYDYDVYLSGNNYNYGMSRCNIHGNAEVSIYDHPVNNAPVKAPQASIASVGANMWIQTVIDGNNPVWKEFAKA